MTNPGQDPRADLGSDTVMGGNPFGWDIQAQVNGVSIDLTSVASSWTAVLRQKPSSTPTVSWAVDASQAASGVLKLDLTGAQTLSMLTGGDSTPPWHFDVKGSGGPVSPQTCFKGTLYVRRSESG